MTIGVRVSYHCLMTDSSDEAISLAGYLGQHGICAHPSDTAVNEVICPHIHGSDTVGWIEKLYETWSLFWEHTDSTLLGLAVYVKE